MHLKCAVLAVIGAGVLPCAGLLARDAGTAGTIQELKHADLAGRTWHGGHHLQRGEHKPGQGSLSTAITELRLAT
jgi:hypothetical protein